MAAFPPILKLATGVVEVITKGAIPVATVEVNCPETLKLVPVASPKTGVIKVGEVASTTLPFPVEVVVPVPPFVTFSVPFDITDNVADQAPGVLNAFDKQTKTQLL